MNDSMCEIIAAYENRKNLPDEDRCTEYCEDLGFYVLKMDISHAKINERYTGAKEALDGKYFADGRKLVAVLHINLGHNAIDKESYPLSDEDVMIGKFLSKKCPVKMIGIKLGEEACFLIRKQENSAPELLALPMEFDKRYLERLDEIRCRWFSKLCEIERVEIRKEIDELIGEGAITQGKQPKFDYAKEICKRMKTNKKIFIEERMEGYDFREIDLSGALFINCSLTRSNFCGVNLENTVFVNCELKDSLFLGAMLNNCRAYYGGSVINLEDKSRRIVS